MTATLQRIARRRTTVPAAPTNASAAGGNTTASVSFATPVTDGGSPITGYTAISTPGSFSQSGASSPLVVTGLSNGTPYTFTVHATNALGNSAESGASNSATPSNPASVPGAPTIGTATGGNAQASVPFSAPGSDGGSAILDYTATSSPGGLTGTAAGSPVTVSGLTNGQAYTFTVTARNAVGSGPASGSSNSVTPSTVPGAPTIGTATAGNKQATVPFSAPASDGGSAITSYTATASPGGFTASGSGSPLTVTGLTNGQAYTFSVAAANANGVGAASGNSNSVTPTLVNHTVTLDKSVISDARGSNGGLSDTCTATVHDGAGSFVYSWTWSAGGVGLNLTNASTATVTISGSGTIPHTEKTGTLRCTVTDNGNSSYSAYAEASVDFLWDNT